MKNVLNYCCLLIIVFASCNGKSPDNNTNISIEQADFILNTKNIYALEYNEFLFYLDSVKQLIKVDKNKLSEEYFFKQKMYAYNLNHSLIKSDTCINMYTDFKKILTKSDFSEDTFLKNDYFKHCLISYLDLTAKYRIAVGIVNYRDNIFINSQLDIIKEELNGKIKEYALLKVIEQQIQVFGHNGLPKMLDYFHKNCSNTDYKNHIDSLNCELQKLISDSKEQIYKIDNQDSMLAYIFYPKKNIKPNPCIIILHGGGWYIGHPLQRNNITQDFNKLGITAICIEYSIKGRQNATPIEGLKDAKSAIRWVRKNSDKLGIDSEKIIVSGMSSGGTLAAATALIVGYEEEGEDLNISSKPNAVILWSACIDPSINNWFKYCLRGKDDSKNLSPSNHIAYNQIPFLIFQAQLDKYNDYKTHIEFRDKMEKVGNYCELVLFKNTHHIEVYNKNMTNDYKKFITFAFKK